MLGPMKRLPALLASLIAASFAQAENWPQWRGPRLDGTSVDAGFPVTAEGTKTWQVELPGSGHASPIVWEDKIFTVAALPESEERVLLCLDRASGKLLWQSSVLKAPAEGIHKLNSLASSTPATDGERVFTAFLDNTPTEATRKANEGHADDRISVPNRGSPRVQPGLAFATAAHTTGAVETGLLCQL